MSSAKQRLHIPLLPCATKQPLYWERDGFVMEFGVIMRSHFSHEHHRTINEYKADCCGWLTGHCVPSSSPSGPSIPPPPRPPSFALSLSLLPSSNPLYPCSLWLSRTLIAQRGYTTSTPSFLRPLVSLHGTVCGFISAPTAFRTQQRIRKK